ncbi:hypothetical protein PFISCL1PPCAC_14762, partial [Pristionchus fissidentatus]
RGGMLVDIRVPNVFGSFEATLGVLGADAFLLFILLICSWKLSGKDVAKPFLCVLTLCMALSTIATIALFVFKMNYMSDECAAYASMVNAVARFASVNSLLFGGGYYLLGSGNAARTRAESVCCSSWSIHLSIAISSAIIATTAIFCSPQIENIPTILYRITPMFGTCWLLFGCVV